MDIPPEGNVSRAMFLRALPLITCICGCQGAIEEAMQAHRDVCIFEASNRVEYEFVRLKSFLRRGQIISAGAELEGNVSKKLSDRNGSSNSKSDSIA
eukprot:758738-Hanusia_phi.AAC.1